MHTQRKAQSKGSKSSKTHQSSTKSPSHQTARSLRTKSSKLHKSSLRTPPTQSSPSTPLLSITSPISTQSSRTRSVSTRKLRRTFSTTPTDPANDHSLLPYTPNQQRMIDVAHNDDLVQKMVQELDNHSLSIHDIKNHNFVSPFLAENPPHKVIDTLPVVTEEGLTDKILYEAKIKHSRKYRAAEYVREHQPQMRAAIVGVPSAAAMYATHDFANYLSQVIETQGYDLLTQTNLIMALGAFQALVAVGLMVNANNILSLAGQPSESVIQDIVRRTLRNKDLHAKVGSHLRFGHFVSLATIPGGPRFWGNKAHHHQEWLAHDKGTFEHQTPDIAFPNVTQRFLNMFPFFKQTQWNTASEQKVALDMKNHPAKYLTHYDESIPVYDDYKEVHEQYQEELMASLNEQLADIQQQKKELDEKEDITTTSTDQSSTNSTDLATITPSNSTALAIPSKLTPPPPPPKTPEQIEQDRKMRRIKVTSYNGWERYWQPRRLTLSAHIVGTQDEGLLLCEVEKFNYGPAFRYSGGMTQYKVFQFVSLKTGEVTNFDQVERPSLLTHAHLRSFFDTMPADYVTHNGQTIAKM